MKKSFIQNQLMAALSACLLAGNGGLFNEVQAQGQCSPAVERCELYPDQVLFRGAKIGASLLLAGETLNDDAVAIVEQCDAFPESRFVGIDGDDSTPNGYSRSIFTQTISSYTDAKGRSTAALAGVQYLGEPAVLFLDTSDTDAPSHLGTFKVHNEHYVDIYGDDVVGASGAFLEDGRFLMVHTVENGAQAPQAKLLSLSEAGAISVDQAITFPDHSSEDRKPMGCALNGTGVLCAGKRTLLGARLNPAGQLETWQSNPIPDLMETKGQFSTHIMVNGSYAYVQRTIKTASRQTVSIVLSLDVRDPANPTMDTINYVTSAAAPMQSDRPYANLLIAEQKGEQYLIAAAPWGQRGAERVSKYLALKINSPLGDLWRGLDGQGGSSGTADEVAEGFIYGRPLGVLGDMLIAFDFGRLVAHDLSNLEQSAQVLPVLARQPDRGCRLFEPGDMNCDQRIDNSDIDSFVAAIINPHELDEQTQGWCTSRLADFNLNGRNDFFDIDPFVQRLNRTQ